MYRLVDRFQATGALQRGHLHVVNGRIGQAGRNDAERTEARFERGKGGAGQGCLFGPQRGYCTFVSFHAHFAPLKNYLQNCIFYFARIYKFSTIDSPLFLVRSA